MISFLVERVWYGNHPLRWFLLPFSWFFCFVSQIRRWYLEMFCSSLNSVPIIVVGNITVGGVGKTPLVIELANRIKEKGIKVGIVSRGYKAKVKTFPHEVHLQDMPEQVGDEPLLIAEKTHCPVVIAPKRIDAVHYLINTHKVDLIISDDGLQHYQMGRDIEIIVIDGTRGLGNGLCLPAGPLRESNSRLKLADFIVINEGNFEYPYSMKLVPGAIKNLKTQEEISLDSIDGPSAAVAAIGNPQRFYSTLKELGIEFNAYSFPDHYQFQCEDLNFSEPLIIMTEKDAVKCRSFSSDKLCFLPVNAVLDEAFWNALWSHQRLNGLLT